MRPNLIFALALSAALATPLSTALAQQPRHPSPSTAAPQAADQTLGMAIMAASVHQSGDLADGTGAVSSAYDANNEGYFVKFNRPVAHCASAVTPRLAGLTVGSQMYPPGGDTVFVALRTSNGTYTTNPFQLIVFCWN